MKIWVDVKNSHEPLFFKSIIKEFPRYDFTFTSRDYAEIVKLLELYGIKSQVIGNHGGKNVFNKILNRAFSRNFSILKKIERFDVGLSHMSLESAHVSKLKSKPSISFTDNDFNQIYTQAILPFVKYLVIPSCIPPEKFTTQGLSKKKLIQFNGFKEDIYIADYKPDNNFVSSLPFKNFITIRGESLKASYVPKDARSIVPQLLNLFSKLNVNVLFLPRYKSDYKYANNLTNVYIPSSPLNGLDVCYFSKFILTGAGTFAREAACMGKKAVSFFPGNSLLSVDKELIKRGQILHSRNPFEIVRYVMKTNQQKADFHRSITVKKEVIKILDRLFQQSVTRVGDDQ